MLIALWRRYGAKMFRYCGVSAVNVINGQTLLWLFYSPFGWPAWLSNVLAVVISAGPAYWLSRHWVWAQSGTHSVRDEIAPFWGMAVLGLFISTLATSWADHRWGTTVAVQLASLASFGVVWVFKFFVLEHLMWHTPGERVPATPPAPSAPSTPVG